MCILLPKNVSVRISTFVILFARFGIFISGMMQLNILNKMIGTVNGTSVIASHGLANSTSSIVACWPAFFLWMRLQNSFTANLNKITKKLEMTHLFPTLHARLRYFQIRCDRLSKEPKPAVTLDSKISSFSLDFNKLAYFRLK